MGFVLDPSRSLSRCAVSSSSSYFLSLFILSASVRILCTVLLDSPSVGVIMTLAAWLSQPTA